MFILTLMAIVAMGGCGNENVAPDNPSINYEQGMYYESLGGYVSNIDEVNQKILIFYDVDLGPCTSDKINSEINKINQGTIKDWRLPTISEMSYLMTLKFIYQTPDFGLQKKEWYWMLNDGNIQLRLCQSNANGANSEPLTSYDKGDARPIRACRTVLIE
jgi:hypothetical protein